MRVGVSDRPQLDEFFGHVGLVQPMSRMKSSNCVRCSMECGFAISTPWPAYSKLAPFSPFHEGEWCSPSWKGEKGWGMRGQADGTGESQGQHEQKIAA